MQPDEWRSTITAHGEQFVIIAGTLTMLMLFADNLVFVMPLILIEMLVMARELGRFCLAGLIVWVLSHHYFRANIVEWELMSTVITVETLAFDVETQEVRIIDDGYFLFYYCKLSLHGLTCSAIKMNVNKFFIPLHGEYNTSWLCGNTT